MTICLACVEALARFTLMMLAAAGASGVETGARQSMQEDAMIHCGLGAKDWGLLVDVENEM